MSFLSHSVWLLLLLSAVLSTASPVPTKSHNATSTYHPTTTPTSSFDPSTAHNYTSPLAPSGNNVSTTLVPSAAKSEHTTQPQNGVSHLIAEDTYSTGNWIFLVGKIIAGFAALCVLGIVIFLIHRWRVRGRRRRIGNMMGLGIKRNKLMEARHGITARIRQVGKEERVRDVSAHSWRWGDRREDCESDLESIKESPERGRSAGRGRR